MRPTEGTAQVSPCLPTFPESTSVALRCVANMNPAPQVEVPGQVHMQTGGVFQYVVHVVPRVW